MDQNRGWKELNGNMLAYFIAQNIAQEQEREMLDVCFNMRSGILLIDGLDQAFMNARSKDSRSGEGSMLDCLERFVFKELVAYEGHVVIATRPTLEDGRIMRFRSAGFSDMELAPLSATQLRALTQARTEGGRRAGDYFFHMVNAFVHVVTAHV